MTWKVEFSELAKKQLIKLDANTAKRILRFLNDRVRTAIDPSSLATRLKGPENDGRWRYGVGDYRIVVSFEKSTITIYLIELGHRREIYR